MEVKSSTTSPIKLKCPRGPSNTKWVSYRLVALAQKNRKLFGNKSTEAWKIKLDVPSVKYNFGSKSRELDLKILGGVGASLRRGRECQGRTIFWLTRLELRLPRGITAADLSAVPSFFTFCNTIALEPSLLHSLLDKKSFQAFQAFQTDTAGSESLPSVRERGWLV